MKCTDLEILLCDYVDGTLTAQEKATVELHLATCAECRELVADAGAAVNFMARAEQPEPPAALINKILFEARDGKASPVRARSGLLGWLGSLVQPVLSPKFAMGMVMTILSFSMLGRFAGIPARQLKAQDLEPARIVANLEDKAVRTWERAVKYYQSLRLVYEMQQTFREWTADADQPAETKDAKDAKAEEKTEGPIPRMNEGSAKQ